MLGLSIAWLSRWIAGQRHAAENFVQGLWKRSVLRGWHEQTYEEASTGWKLCLWHLRLHIDPAEENHPAPVSFEHRTVSILAWNAWHFGWSSPSFFCCRRMHTGEKPHLCPHCSYRSARRDNLRSHVRRMHKRDNMYIDTFNPTEGPGGQGEQGKLASETGNIAECLHLPNVTNNVSSSRCSTGRASGTRGQFRGWYYRSTQQNCVPACASVCLLENKLW